MNAKTILKQLKTSAHLVVSSAGKTHAKTMTALYTEAPKQFKKIGIIALSKPVPALSKELESLGLNASNTHFIDCVSKSNKNLGKIKNSSYVSSPSALTELAIVITKTQQKQKTELFIFDSVSSLLIYNTDVQVLKFLNSIIATLRRINTKAIYVLMKDSKSSLLGDLSLIADKVVDA